MITPRLTEMEFGPATPEEQARSLEAFKGANPAFRRMWLKESIERSRQAPDPEKTGWPFVLHQAISEVMTPRDRVFYFLQSRPENSHPFRLDEEQFKAACPDARLALIWRLESDAEDECDFPLDIWRNLTWEEKQARLTFISELDKVDVRRWFSATVPSGYQHTRLESLPNRAATMMALSRQEDEDLDASHYLFGASGTGKTRTAYLLMRSYREAMNRFERDREPLLIRASDLKKEIVERTRPGGKGGFQDFFDDLCWRHQIVIDELDKMTWSPRVESEFFDLIETRMAHEQSIIYTSNLTPEAALAGMSDNYRAATVRRIKENCAVVNFNARPGQ